MAHKRINPFVCQGYMGPEYFCDREKETKKLSSTLYNGRHVTLISPRRLGKTGLIWHTFHHIRQENKDTVCVYVDVFPTRNPSEFTRMLGEAVLNATLSKSRLLGKRAMEALSGFRPVLSIDQLSGLPNVSLSVEPNHAEMSLHAIFDYMKRQQKEFFVAIDEFQQITTYAESGMEALLRSQIQFAPNVHFIFSGSRQHLMAEMFISPKRPFYHSTELMNLTPLDEQVYFDFANHFFTLRKGHLNSDIFHELYTQFDGYTWYIQSILNRMYETYTTVNTMEQLAETLLSVVNSNAPQYESLVQFLTIGQMSLLLAIAREGKVEQPLSKDFIKKHKLSGASSVKTALESLCNKELLYHQPEGYRVYDRFLSLWLRRIG